MKSSAAEIDLKLRDDFRRYLLEYGIESAVIDPVLAVLFRTFASEIYAVSSDTDLLRRCLLDELIEGLTLERRHAHPAQTIVRYAWQGQAVNVAGGTEVMGELESGGRITFATDYGIAVSSARIASVLVYQNGSIRLLSGVELPAETLRAGPSYAPAPANLGPNPAIYVALENLGPSHLSRHGFFFQISPEATLLESQLAEENWCLATWDGGFGAEGLLRPRDLNAGQHELSWLRTLDEGIFESDDAETPRLPAGFWKGRCFVFPATPAARRFLCEAPRGLEPPLRSIFERPEHFFRPRAWIRIQFSPRVEPLHTAVSSVYVNAQSASNVECFNQTVRFAEHGNTIPISRKGGSPSFLVAPLSITGESGQSYIGEFQPSFTPGVGRFRLHQGYLTLLPGKLPGGPVESYANVRLWMTSGAEGNQVGVARLGAFAKAAPAHQLQVTNVTAAAGGTDGESFASAKHRFAETMLSRQRLLTRADIETSIRAFDRRIDRIEVRPLLARSAKGLRRLHRIAISAHREQFVAPEEEGRVLLADLESYLKERAPMDVDLAVELTWT